MADDLNLVGKLKPEERIVGEFRMHGVFSPDDGKYASATKKLLKYLSPGAEWMMCARIQELLIETRAEFGQATEEQVNAVRRAMDKVDAVNMGMLEDIVTRHDQLAVIEEIGRFVSPQTKALLHPGTTSYDVLDTARNYLFRQAWREVMRPEVVKGILGLADIGEKGIDRIQVGRTHLKNTSPVLFGGEVAKYARRVSERTERLDEAFGRLRGKISGIVGTGASIDAVIGRGKSLEFERAVLAKLDLEPDYTATQIVQKETLADVGHGLTSLMYVLGDFANDIRVLYSSAINEVTSRDNAARLGGSSADATKDNPIVWENMAGTPEIVGSGMGVLYSMIRSDLQRDLRGSKPARYQPQQMMVQTFEAFSRLNKALPQLSVNDDVMDRNLQSFRDNPGEAMTAILRGQGWVHSKYGGGHDFVKKIAIEAKKSGRKLLDVAMEDDQFRSAYGELPEWQQSALQGNAKEYLGSAVQRAKINIDYARRFASAA